MTDRDRSPSSRPPSNGTASGRHEGHVQDRQRDRNQRVRTPRERAPSNAQTLALASRSAALLKKAQQPIDSSANGSQFLFSHGPARITSVMCVALLFALP